MTMPPDPAQNKAEWLAAHPGAGEVGADQAAAEVAAHLGAAAPDPGVSGSDLGAQMAAAGAQAGLPHEDVMDQLMAEIRRLSDQVGFLQERDRQREAAQIAALGEPILQRYANGIAAKLEAHQAANPGLGPDHFRNVRGAADSLVKAASQAISGGANDMGQVAYHAGQVDRWLSKTHKRTAPAHLAHLDLGAIEQDLEYLLDEVDRLTGGGQLAVRG